MKADDTMAVNAKTFHKIAKMVCRLVDHIRKEKSLPEKLARETFDQIDDLVKEALIAKPRNCDVGTAEEQTRRLRENCEKFKPSCKGCKVFGDIHKENCWLTWAQMPYKEGGME